MLSFAKSTVSLDHKFVKDQKDVSIIFSKDFDYAMANPLLEEFFSKNKCRINNEILQGLFSNKRSDFRENIFIFESLIFVLMS